MLTGQGHHTGPYAVIFPCADREFLAIQVKSQILVKAQIILFYQTRVNNQALAVKSVNFLRRKNRFAPDNLFRTVFLRFADTPGKLFIHRPSETKGTNAGHSVKTVFIQPLQQRLPGFADFPILMAENQPVFVGKIISV